MKTVLVMLSTYNGEKYLTYQLDSILSQEEVDVYLLVRDDGSQDNTIAILEKYKRMYPDRIILHKGNNIGCGKSFRWVMEEALIFGERRNIDYYAFSDQDDIWNPEKLKIALKALSVFSSSIPCLFFSHYQMIDNQSRELPTTRKSYNLSLGEALIMNPSVGCTQVFNKTCLTEALKGSPPCFVLHDWWLYSVCQALSGNVVYENKALVQYRQHMSNVVGGKDISRVQKLKNWLFKKHNNLCMSLAISIYDNYHKEMDGENIKLVQLCMSYRQSFLNRLKLISSVAKFWTLNPDVNYGFVLSVIFGKF